MNYQLWRGGVKDRIADIESIEVTEAGLTLTTFNEADLGIGFSVTNIDRDGRAVSYETGLYRFKTAKSLKDYSVADGSSVLITERDGKRWLFGGSVLCANMTLPTT